MSSAFSTSESATRKLIGESVDTARCAVTDEIMRLLDRLGVAPMSVTAQERLSEAIYEVLEGKLIL